MGRNGAVGCHGYDFPYWQCKDWQGWMLKKKKIKKKTHTHTYTHTRACTQKRPNHCNTLAASFSFFVEKLCVLFLLMTAHLLCSVI